MVRLAQVRRYNRSFGKGERVTGADLARLLCFGADPHAGDDDDASRAAVDFCRDVGLPVVDDGDGEICATMKMAPIAVAGEDAVRRICNPGRTADCFVFGCKSFDDSCVDDLKSLANQLSRCDIEVYDAVDDWEERGVEDSREANRTQTSAPGNGFDSSDESSRKDEDGVSIPPSNVLLNLIG